MNINESLNVESELLPEGYYYSPRGYLWFVLPIEKFSGLPEEVFVEGNRFVKKKEFHATVINGRGVATDLTGGSESRVVEIEKELQKILTDYIKTFPIKFDGFEDDLRLAKQNNRISIAARCKLINLEGYFEEINRKYGKRYAIQPPHVSIYTLPDGLAVGIDSVEQMESYKKVSVPEVQNFLDSITL